MQDKHVGEDLMFEFLDVVVQRQRMRALDGLTAAIPGRGVTAVFGPSGSGNRLVRLLPRT